MQPRNDAMKTVSLNNARRAREMRSADQVFIRALILGAMVGVLLAELVGVADLFSSAPPDDDPMTITPAAGFLLAVPVGAISGASCAAPAAAAWMLTARFSTRIRYLAASLTVAFCAILAFLGFGTLDWEAAGLASGGALAAVALARTITSRPAEHPSP